MARPKKKPIVDRIEELNKLPEHVEVLKKYKYIYDLFIKTGEIVGLYPHIREEIVTAYKVEFPHFHYQKTCSVCTGDMLKEVYNWYDKQIQ